MLIESMGDRMKDILVFLSDQHSYAQQGYAGDKLVRTPNLDRIAAEGTAMENNYTAYPLCVPARMAMLTGQQASNCGVMSNFAALDSNRATFAHCLNIAGYETVLCGRMHFVGGDQRHGFSSRIAGEMTPVYANRPKAIAQERGAHDRTPQGGPSCLSAIGGGNSPTLEFDRYVVDHALEYLAEDHEKPQLLFVGTYGPHHPYVAPKELYEYYRDKVNVPEESFDYPEHPALKGRILRDTDPEVVRAVRAAYYGMVEFEDQQIGKVYDAFQAYLKRTGHEGVFVYVSDHGDHIGTRGYYGKSTFYEQSAHTPMIFAGDGVACGRRIKGATSLIDLGPTLCELAGAPPMPAADGISLWGQLSKDADDSSRIVVSELGGEFSFISGTFSYGQMAKQGKYKLIHFDGFDGQDVLYDLEADPAEERNVISEHPDVAARLRNAMEETCESVDQIYRNAELLRKNLPILTKCDLDVPEERWHAPECARHLPDPMVKSKRYAH